MSFKEAIETCFTKYVDFSGRARRSEYWYFTLFNMIVSLAIGSLVAATTGDDGNSPFGFISGIYSLAVFLPSLGVMVRRMHDTGRTGWSYLYILIPLVGIIIVLVYLCKDSQLGANDYGPNPKDPFAVSYTPVVETTPQITEQKKYCTGCGAQLAEGQKFCTNCGKEV